MWVIPLFIYMSYPAIYFTLKTQKIRYSCQFPIKLIPHLNLIFIFWYKSELDTAVLFGNTGINKSRPESITNTTNEIEPKMITKSLWQSPHV